MMFSICYSIRDGAKMVAPFFVPKIGEDQKKGLRCKISGFSVQKYVKTKKKKKKKQRSSPKNQRDLSPNEDGDDQTK